MYILIKYIDYQHFKPENNSHQPVEIAVPTATHFFALADRQLTAVRISADF